MSNLSLIKKKAILLATFFTLSWIFGVKGLVYAKEEKVNPGDDYKYVIKRLKEKVRLSFLSVSPRRKINFYSNLVEVRLSELSYVVEKRDIANIQTTSQRYAAITGNATDLILAKGSKEDRQKLIEKFKSHLLLIKELQKSYLFDTAEWMFLEHDVNSLKSYISKLSE